MSKGGSSGNQTVTQQNIPDWAMGYAQDTLNLGNQYTMFPGRPTTLDRDYSGIRGYNPQGQPNSQVGQSGLNPMPVQPMPVIPPEETTKRDPYTGELNSQKMSQFHHGDPDGDGTFDTPLTFRPGQGFFLPDGSPYSSKVVGSGDQITQYYGDPDGDGTFDTPIERGPDGFYQMQPQTAIRADAGESGSTPTGFQAYDRQRFAAPSDRTLQGEGLLADRINEANPYQQAQDVAGRVANYESGYNPAELNLNGPQANSYNNVLQALRSSQYGNANAGLTGPQGYTTGRSFQDRVQDFMNPYTDQVVNSALKDINRARQMADLSTMGGAAKSGAFGGSREALMRAENTRNALDQAASTAGQLRSQGFNTAANLAQQEELQRLGLTATDLQNVRGYQSAGNLQGQSLTASDLQNVRGLQSQGALNSQNLGAQSDRDVMNYQQQLQRQGNQIAADQARLAEQFRQSAGALNLQGAGALGNLTQMGVNDRRQRIADLLASGGAGDARNQQDLDFIFSEFNRELDYPGRQIDLRNAAISPATGSIVTTTQPRYQQNPLLGAAGSGLGAYALMASNPVTAPYALAAGLGMGGLSLLS